MIQAKEWILNWFAKNTYNSIKELEENSHENYFDMGFLDSFGFISLIAAVEDNFAIVFDESQFQQPTFSTINGISEIIEELLRVKEMGK